MEFEFGDVCQKSLSFCPWKSLNLVKKCPFDFHLQEWPSDFDLVIHNQLIEEGLKSFKPKNSWSGWKFGYSGLDSFQQLTYLKICSLAAESSHFPQLTSQKFCLLRCWKQTDFQNRISRSLKIHFSCMNSRSTSRESQLSNGVVRYWFGSREGVEKFPASLSVIFPFANQKS